MLARLFHYDVVRIEIPQGQPEATHNGRLGYVVAVPGDTHFIGHFHGIEIPEREEGEEPAWWVVLPGESGPRWYKRSELRKVE